MNHSLLQDCWKIICESETARLADRRLPLANIEKYLLHFGLTPLELSNTNFGDYQRLSLPAEPSFKVLEDEFLLEFRRATFDDSKSLLVSQWAEVLMRFCEVRYYNLKSRAIEKCGTLEQAQIHILHLAVFLMDYAINFGDVRPLNTTLKIADLNWVINRKTIPSGLTRSGNRFIAAIFQFRVILAVEYALEQLRKGKF